MRSPTSEPTAREEGGIVSVGIGEAAGSAEFHACGGEGEGGATPTPTAGMTEHTIDLDNFQLRQQAACGEDTGSHLRVLLR